MTPEQFCYWLQGRAELRPDDQPTAEEWKSIREHLETVFVKETPPMPRPPVDLSRLVTPRADGVLPRCEFRDANTPRHIRSYC